jgi:hypothetical protein
MEQGDHHSIAGKVEIETPRRCFLGDIHAAQFKVRFRAPFGHRRMAPLMSPTDPKRTFQRGGVVIPWASMRPYIGELVAQFPRDNGVMLAVAPIVSGIVIFASLSIELGGDHAREADV